MGKKLFLGHKYIDKKPSREKMYINTEDLLTHIFICGATGSGKTVLGKILIEEAILADIPAVLIDLKGDLSSMAIPYSKLDKSDIEKWVDARNQEELDEKSTQTLKYYKANMVRSELLSSDLERFRKKVEVKIYTPKSLMGTPLSLSPLSNPSFDVEEMYKSDRESFINLVGTVTDSIFERIFLENERESMIEERAFLEEIITHLWLKKVSLEGKTGIVELLKSVINPPVDIIGIMKPSDFLSDERRHRMARRLNRLLVGAESLWYEGESIISVLNDISKMRSKTPVVIFNLSHLDTFEERNLVVSQVAYTIYSWMRKKIDSSGPRLLFYIDEIGGGGKHAFFPDEPHQNSSKSAINLLLRQGRAFGVCCILSTQNPGDIDYRGLTNCQTWFIGKLLTEQDREKIIQGLIDISFVVKHFEDFIKTAEPGDFAVKLRGGNVYHFRERWLLTFHKVLTREEFPILKKNLIFENIISKIDRILEDESLEFALSYIDSKIKELGQDVNLLITRGDLLHKLKRYDEAIDSLKTSLKLNETDTAYLKLGNLYVEIVDYEKALEAYEKGLKINNYNEFIHEAMGKIYQTLGMYEQAEQAFALATKANMNLETIWNNRGWLSVEIGNGKEAIRNFERALSLKKNNEDSQIGLAMGNHLIGNTVNALLELSEVLKNNPENRKALYFKSTIHSELKEYEEALEYSETLIKIDKSSSKSWFNHGKILYLSGKLKESVKILNHTIKLDSNNYKAWDYLGLSFMNLGENEKAIASFKKAISIKTGSAELKYHLVEAYRKSGKIEEELVVLREISEKFPDYYKAWVDLAWHSVKNGNIEEGIKLLNTGLNNSMGNEELIYNKAELLYLLGKNGEVVKLIENIQYLDKENPNVLILEAKALRDDGNIRKSLEVFSRGISIFPDNKELLVLKGKLLLKEKIFREADECFEKLSKLDEENPEVWYTWGDVKKGIFDEDGAALCYKKAEELKAK